MLTKSTAPPAIELKSIDKSFGTVHANRTVSMTVARGSITGIIGEILNPAKQRFPLMSRQAAIVEIGARPFAAMIEKADVVVGLLDRLDLARDELVELVEISNQVGRQCKIQGSSP